MPMSIVADSELNASSSIDRVGAKSKTCCPIGLCLSGLISLLFSTLAGEYRPPLWCEQGEGAECEGEKCEMQSRTDKCASLQVLLFLLVNHCYQYHCYQHANHHHNNHYGDNS